MSTPTRLARRLLRLLGRRPQTAVAPARYAPLLPVPVSIPVPAPRSADSEPRPLAAYELADEHCPHCDLPATSGEHQWRDRGPFQLLSRHTYRCPAGHAWTHETDGG